MYSTLAVHFFFAVVQTLIAKEQTLNKSVLFLRQHYQFMEPITETSSKMISLDADVLAYAVSNGEKLNFYQKELAEEIKKYMEQLIVKEIQFCKKLLDTFSEFLITSMNKHNITIT